MTQRCIPCFIIVLFLFSSAPVLGETYYRWQDEKGVVHITNTPKNVPEGRGLQEEELGPPSETGPQRNVEPPIPPSPRRSSQPAPAPMPPSSLQEQNRQQP